MQKIGILGGGQLGRMLLQASANYVVETFLMENDENCPAAHLCHHFVKGNIQDYDDVVNFGKNLDAITIEIEAVNIDALETLESMGVRVYPKPSAIRIIKNKITQKAFYQSNKIPTSPFVITQNRREVLQHLDKLPAVHKIGEGGYDGKGVEIIHQEKDIEKAFDAPSVLEEKVDIQQEIAVIVAKDDKGNLSFFPPVEMMFNHSLNLLDFQLAPARLPEKTLWKVEAIAQKVVQSLQSAGIFAVELFVDRQEEVYVNETAPRVHNSGHHTIEANYCSQYDMLWRIMLQYPPGNTASITPSSIVNILGEQGYEGIAHYEGLEEVLKMDNVFVHLYGKEVTKGGRKMGHVTILSNDNAELIYLANKVKNTLKVVSK